MPIDVEVVPVFFQSARLFLEGTDGWFYDNRFPHRDEEIFQRHGLLSILHEFTVEFPRACTD